MEEQDAAKSMDEIEWVSVSKYLHWLEVQSELIPFSVSAVYSFRVGRGGFGALAAQKGRLLNLLEGNLRNLEEWVLQNEDDMDDNERVFARSLYRTTLQYMDISREYRDRAVVLQKATQSFEIPTGGIGECGDELPF